jgi:hypothetical protein
MAKVQAVGSETVNAYGAQGLPASFDFVVNGDNGKGVRVGFSIRDLNGQNLYVSGMLNGSDARVAETALNEANLEYQKSDRNTFGSNGAPGCTIFQLSKVRIGLANDPDYCARVVDFVRGQQRVA